MEAGNGYTAASACRRSASISRIRTLRRAVAMQPNVRSAASALTVAFAVGPAPARELLLGQRKLDLDPIGGCAAEALAELLEPPCHASLADGRKHIVYR